MASLAKKAKLDTTPKKQCPYGASCYRKNPAHLKEFSHDNSSATTSPPDNPKASPSKRKDAKKLTATDSVDTSNLTPCKYGAKCYRKNLLHFAEYSHPTKSTTNADSDSGDTDVCDSDDDKSRKPDAPAPKDGLKKAALDRGMSLVKSFTRMSEEERKALIRMAFEAKERLEKELEATKIEMARKDKELSTMQEEMNKGMLFVAGEKEALNGNKTVYFTLLPERNYKEGSADQMHFRIAESQFYRLVTGDSNESFRVTKVQYVVTPHLVKQFKAAREKLKQDRGEEMSYPVLGFHGTDDKNITPICETGFRMPGSKGFREKTDAGWYGAGIYFSEYPSYSMDYISGAERLLLCQLLPGKVFQCTDIDEGSELEKGYDSHMSPDKKEIVIFNSDCILPCYVVHYKRPDKDFQYKKVTAGRKRVRKTGGGVSRTGDPVKSLTTKAKKVAASKIFEGKSFMFATKNLKQENAMLDLVKKHKGAKGTADKCDVMVASESVDAENNSSIETALEKDIPVVDEEYLYECIIQKKFLDPDYFLHELYD